MLAGPTLCSLYYSKNSTTLPIQRYQILKKNMCWRQRKVIFFLNIYYQPKYKNIYFKCEANNSKLFVIIQEKYDIIIYETTIWNESSNGTVTKIKDWQKQLW